MASLLRVIVVEVASLLLATLKRGGGGGGCIWAKRVRKRLKKRSLIALALTPNNFF
jgi:hypothetical protein